MIWVIIPGLSNTILFGQQSARQNLFKTIDGIDYYLYLPENHHVQKSYPLLIFLHGASSIGNINTGNYSIHFNGEWQGKELIIKYKYTGKDHLVDEQSSFIFTFTNKRARYVNDRFSLVIKVKRVMVILSLMLRIW